MKRLILFALLIGGMLMAVHASSTPVIQFSKDSLVMTTELSVSRDSLGRDYALELTPVLFTSSGDSLVLDGAVFRGAGNEKYVKRQRSFGEVGAPTEPEYRLGDTVSYQRVIRRDDAPQLWREPVFAALMRYRSGCCNDWVLSTIPLGEGQYVIDFHPVVAPVEDNKGRAGELQEQNPVLQHISNYRPYDTTRILRKEEGMLYVHFPLDKWDLRRDFRENAATLDQIVDITRQILADNTSNVRLIQIIGLASVEGPVRRNTLLGENRALALKNYVLREVPQAETIEFELVNGGEAWTELRDQISDLSIPGRDELLEIIDTETNADRRERRIRSLQGGKPYGYLRDNILSDQRNSGYMRIYFDYVPDVAAKDINEASLLLQDEKYEDALRILERYPSDARAWNALGTALYMTGNKDEGIRFIRQAADIGNPEAIENLRRLELIP